jgi:hypothetical protein
MAELIEVLVGVGRGSPYDFQWQSPDAPAPTVTTRWPRRGRSVGWILVLRLPPEQEARDG